MPVQNATLINFVVLLIVFVVICNVWDKFVMAFVYGTMGFDQRSGLHTFIVALVITLIAGAYLYFAGSDCQRMLVHKHGLKEVFESREKRSRR